MPLFDPYAEIPGYAEFVDEQDAIRDAAFLGLPWNICGMPVKMLTTRHLQWLLMIKSPFVGGQQLYVGEAHLHIAAFMRVVSSATGRDLAGGGPESSPLNRFRRRLFFWRYRRTIYPQHLTAPQMVDAIRVYLDKMMQDSPAHGNVGVESYWSVGAMLVHALCGHYGWTLDEALDCPLPAAFQLMKIQRREDAAQGGVKSVLFNPSDGFKSRFFEKQENNRRSQTAATN